MVTDFGFPDVDLDEIEMDFILEGSTTSSEEIIEYCKEEQLYGLEKNQTKIGFR